MSVLSHLTLRFSTHPENLATEALAYILDRSPSARHAMSSLTSSLSARTISLERFETQTSNDDQSRPDLIGFDTDGIKEAVIEVKFWAGLTEAQPVAYLASMQHSGILLFVAPAARLQSLWGELTRRVDENNLLRAPLTAGGTLACSVGGHVMAAISWRDLLSALHAAVDVAGEVQASTDIGQLMALCDHMDTDAFLPLSSEEITAMTGRRIVQFGTLASDLTDYLVTMGLADVRGLRATGALGSYGRYLYLKGHGAFLHFNASKWAEWGQSPIWLMLTGPNFSHSPSVAKSLRAAGIEFREDGKSCYIPIRLKTGVERECLVASAREQLLAVADTLDEVARGETPADLPL